jgi:signal-transduction protein with cAMP-binding, CBS, and nucleotidyltransferase domain
MSRGVTPVDPSASVQEAARQMAELDVGAVLVGSEDALEGILTDRDILLRVVVDGRDPSAVAVRDVMSSSLFSCKVDDRVESVLAEMRERQIRRMPVYDESGRAVGFVALSDLAKAVRSPEQIHETLREISEPHRSRKAPPADEPEEPKQEAAEGPSDAAGSRA